MHIECSEALIRRLTPSELERLQKLLREAELNDCRPSQLFHQMQQLAGSTTNLDSRLVRELVLQRLPTPVCIGVTASGEMAVYKIVELAHRLMAVAPPAVAAVLAEASPSPAWLEIRIQISASPILWRHCSQAEAKERSGELKNATAVRVPP
ncbi:hypothetical protein MRX96_039246 [Rhipicephalus microplus]